MAGDQAASPRRNPGDALAAAGLPLATAGLGVVALTVAPLLAAVRFAFRSPQRWFGLYTWLLPLHVLVMSILFGPLELEEGVVRAIAAWKELTVLVLLGTVTAGAVLSRGRARILAPDVAAFVLSGLAVAHLVVVDAIPMLGLPIVSRLYGMRDAVFVLALYAIGRATPSIVSDPAVARRFVRLGLVAAVIAIVELLFFPMEGYVLLGVSRYFNDFLNVGAFTEGNEYGLPMNFWTGAAGYSFRRAGSLWLSSQGYAISGLLIVPAATILLLERKRIPWGGLLAYGLLWLGVLLTLTRMSILACGIEVIVLLVLYRKRVTLAAIAVLCTLLVGALCVVSPGIRTFLWLTLTFETGSSASHIKDWGAALVSLVERPWGAGLGTADMTATRFGAATITSDNQFFKYGVELGLAGLVAFLVLLTSVYRAGLRLFREADATRRGTGALVVAATMGIAANGNTAVIFNITTLAYLYFWLAGAAVSAAQDGPPAPR